MMPSDEELCCHGEDVNSGGAWRADVGVPPSLATMRLRAFSHSIILLLSSYRCLDPLFGV